MSPSPHVQPQMSEPAECDSKEMLTQNSLALEAQVEERPLAKKQEELQSASKQSDPPSNNESTPPVEASGSVTTSAKTKNGPARKALLKNNDTELKRVSDVRCLVHYTILVLTFFSYWRKSIGVSSFHLTSTVPKNGFVTADRVLAKWLHRNCTT